MQSRNEGGTTVGKIEVSRKALVLALAGMLAASMLIVVGCGSSSSSSSASSASASSGVQYTVPNVVSLKQEDAEKAIYASGLMVGKITLESSDTAPAGTVIKQSPEGLTNAPANSKIDLVVSSGKKEAKDVIVPDLKGKTQEEAEKALSEVGLVGVPSNPEETDEVDPGKVFKQSVAAGAKAKEGSNVAFTVALAPGKVAVPNVVGKSRDAAKTTLTDAKLGFDYSTAYDNNVPEGNVVSQSVTPGSQVKAGTTVTVVVSLGAKPAQNVKVPNVVTLNWGDAQAALQSAGLACRYTGDPAGTVVSQDIAAGTEVAPNTLVTVTLASPAKTVEVPDLVGMSLSNAEQTAADLNLVLSVEYGARGTIASQSPAPGTVVDERSSVFVTVVPSTEWTPASSASDAAQNAGVDGFDVMDSIVIGNNTFNSPAFAYTDYAVQAVYELPACTVCLRKGQGEYAAKLTDRNIEEFPQTWTQNHKGLEIKCYGAEEGAATVIQWKIDDATFYLTYQGYGGEEMTMDPDDITSLVSGIQ